MSGSGGNGGSGGGGLPDGGSGDSIGTGGAVGTGGNVGTGGTGGGSGGAAGGSGGMGGGGSGGAGGGGVGEGKMCGGIAGIRCEARLFCELDAGVCTSVADASGICRARPMACPDIAMPVCGCDGKTYGNDCDRRAAGVSKKADGACGTKPGEVGVGESCGGFRPMPPVCKAGLFCELPAGTCNRIADIPGTCAEVPAACTREFAPVCGCDGKTYSNDCVRLMARVSLVAKGACPTDPNGGKTCGGIAGLPCPTGYLCDLPAGSCGSADLTGMCVQTGPGCTKELAPVCGCDGKTYGNDCMRRAAGAMLDHRGPC